jgi:hypothetical protein
VSILAVSGCGGTSGGGTTGTPPIPNVAPGTYTVKLVVSAGATIVTQPLTLTVQ